MQTVVLNSAEGDKLGWRVATLPAWVWWLLAFTAVAAKALLTTGQGLSANLGDVDDATRLIEVREFIAGKSWFDTFTVAIGGDGGLLSHWSRLIDLALATLIRLLSIFTPPEHAELLTRAVWPLMVAAPLMWVLYRATAKMADETAGKVALVLCVLCPLGLYQFDAGRIDHHNVMIASTVSAAALVWAWYGDNRAWRIAGALTGLSLVIGYEALAPAVVLATTLAVLGLVGRAPAASVRSFTVAMLATMVIGFIVTIPPSRWFDIRCDAISLNLVALAVCSGTGLVAALSHNYQFNWTHRFSIAAAAAITGLTLYAFLEPACLTGPLGQTPAALRPIWLDQVVESRSILADLVHGTVVQACGLLLFFSLGLAAQVRRAISRPASAEIFMACAVVSFVAFAFWQYKYMAYASFITIPPLARWISRFKPAYSVSAGTVQLAAALMLSQGMMLGGSKSLQNFIDAPVIAGSTVRYEAEVCTNTAAVRELGGLPAGRIAANIDLGAYIAALTPHQVLSAPYHRIGDAIIANHQIFSARDAAQAEALLKTQKIDYVVICRDIDAPSIAAPEWAGTLRAGLVGGRAPAYLEPVRLSNPKTPYSVWRMRKDAISPRP